MIQINYIPTGTWDGEPAGPRSTVPSARDRVRAGVSEQRQLTQLAQEARTD